MSNTTADQAATADDPPRAWFRASTTIVLAAVAAIVALRLGTLATLALTDNTEARYAGISWQMFHSGNWITPQLYLEGQLVNFWAKPPLFFWMTALSIGMCGANEWGARLPNFLIAVAVVGMTIAFGRRFWGPRVGALAGLVLASSGLFFVLAGSCILDLSLAASVSLALMSFGMFAASQGQGQGQGQGPEGGQLRGRAPGAWWGRAFFLSLGVGCLAKGPVAVVLVVLAAGAWIAIRSEWRILKRLPWVTGTLTAAIVACPWYVLAERATPGFLEYFLVREHILRYLRTDYGDLYGAGRTQPYGATWVMLVVSFLPWSLLLIRFGIDRWRKRRKAPAANRDAWLLFALIWGLTPAIFFTLCRQVLVTYVLPGFPGLALATAVILDRWIDSADVRSLTRGLRAMCVGLGVLVVAGLAAELVLAVSPWAFAGTFLAGLLFVAIAWHGQRCSDATVLVAAAGQGTALLIGIGLVAAGPWINESFSTKTILNTVARLPEGRGETVFFPLAYEYSADFYQEAALGRRLERHPHKGLELLVEKLREPSDEVFVFRRRDWQELEGAIRAKLTPIAETGHWVACRGRGENRISQAGPGPSRR